jgi:excisionase family DNA binding protein
VLRLGELKEPSWSTTMQGSDLQHLIGIQELRYRLGGISRATVYRMIERGELPSPLKLGPRLSRFRQSD